MTLVLQITAAGPAAPDYPSILSELQGKARTIFGTDINIDDDSADGQLLAVFAQAIYDSNQAGIAVYNEFSPATAFGTGLSSVVKINGIRRQVPTGTTVDVTIVGVAGSVITAGIVSDQDGNQYLLPPLVEIPLSGEIAVTATSVAVGAISSPIGSVTTIVNPQRGWQSVSNAAASVEGAPVESDAALRRRQSISTMNPSQTILEGITGDIATIPGVVEYKAVENDGDAVDSNGIPGHTTAFIIEGGDAFAIAQEIATKKDPGMGTYGTTTEYVTDMFGIPRAIKFYRPLLAPIAVSVSIKALTGFTTVIQAELQQAIVDFLNALPIGQDVLLTRLYTPANLFGAPDSLTYDITDPIIIARAGNPLVDEDIDLLFYEQATSALDLVTITVSV